MYRHTNRQADRQTGRECSLNRQRDHTHTHTHTASQTGAGRGTVKHAHPEGPVTVLESLVVFAQLDQRLSAVGVQHGVVPHLVDSLSQPLTQL